MSATNNQVDEPILGLPAPGDASPSSVVNNSGDNTWGIKMDHLGPIILNLDGTMSRISNWDALTDGERAVACKRIAQRNRERAEALLAAEKEGAAAAEKKE